MAQKRKDKAKKRVVNVEAIGQAHIRASFNNIIISVTNISGQLLHRMLVKPLMSLD
jgi:small subunit ribosomal protein S11